MAVDIRVSPGDVVVTRDHHGYLSFGYTISASRYQKEKLPPVESGHTPTAAGAKDIRTLLAQDKSLSGTQAVDIAVPSRASLVSPSIIRKKKFREKERRMRTADKETRKKTAWHRPDFVSFDTGMEVTAYFSRD